MSEPHAVVTARIESTLEIRMTAKSPTCRSDVNRGRATMQLKCGELLADRFFSSKPRIEGSFRDQREPSFTGIVDVTAISDGSARVSADVSRYVNG